MSLKLVGPFMKALTSILPGALIGGIVVYVMMSQKSLTRNPSNGFMLMISITFNSKDGMEIFKQRFDEYAKWIRQNEKTTLSYEFCESDKRELEGLILERYTNKEAYMDIHRTTKQFQDFKAGILSMNSDENGPTYGWHLKGESYVETNIGFV